MPGPGPMPGPAPSVPGTLPVDPVMLQEVLMNKKLAGVVIGHNGTNVARVRRESRCKVHVAEVRGGDKQTVELTGTAGQIQYAVDVIREILQDFDPNYSIEVAPALRTTVEIFPGKYCGTTMPILAFCVKTYGKAIAWGSCAGCPCNSNARRFSGKTGQHARAVRGMNAIARHPGSAMHVCTHTRIPALF